MGKQIGQMLDQVPAGKESILNVHCPPYASSLVAPNPSPTNRLTSLSTSQTCTIAMTSLVGVV